MTALELQPTRHGTRSLVFLGLALIVLIAVATVFAVRGHKSGATGTAPQLTSAERQSLVAGQPLIDSLPTAFALVPQAITDLSNHVLSEPAAARAVAGLVGVSDLQGLVAAAPNSASTVVVADQRAALHGRSISAAALDRASARLQLAEGEVVPAVRAVLHAAGIDLAAGTVVTRIESDPKLAALAGLLARWSETYGSMLLLQQAANG